MQKRRRDKNTITEPEAVRLQVKVRERGIRKLCTKKVQIRRVNNACGRDQTQEGKQPVQYHLSFSGEVP